MTVMCICTTGGPFFALWQRSGMCGFMHKYILLFNPPSKLLAPLNVGAELEMH